MNKHKQEYFKYVFKLKYWNCGKMKLLLLSRIDYYKGSDLFHVCSLIALL